MRKHPIFRHATTGFPVKRRLRDELRNSRPRYFSQYKISALVLDASFHDETSDNLTKYRIFSQATEVIRMVSRWDFVRKRKMFGLKQSPHLGLAKIQKMAG